MFTILPKHAAMRTNFLRWVCNRDPSTRPSLSVYRQATWKSKKEWRLLYYCPSNPSDRLDKAMLKRFQTRSDDKDWVSQFRKQRLCQYWRSYLTKPQYWTLVFLSGPVSNAVPVSGWNRYCTNSSSGTKARKCNNLKVSLFQVSSMCYNLCA